MDLILLQKLHGFIAVLGIALAFHPWFALRRSRGVPPRTRIACWLAGLFILLTNAMGWYIYPDYRRELKADLYVYDRFWGDLFEIKEHLGFHAGMLAVAGLVLTAMATGRSASTFRQPIRIVFALCGLLALAVGVFGTLIGAINSFDTEL